MFWLTCALYKISNNIFYTAIILSVRIFGRRFLWGLAGRDKRASIRCPSVNEARPIIARCPLSWPRLISSNSLLSCLSVDLLDGVYIFDETVSNRFLDNAKEILTQCFDLPALSTKFQNIFNAATILGIGIFGRGFLWGLAGRRISNNIFGPFYVLV